MIKDLFLITGASSGIGHALALHFAKLGHGVLAGVRSSKDQTALSSIQHVHPIILDVTKIDEIENAKNLISEKISNYSKLILINNAGITVNGPWEILTTNEIRQQFEVNFFGAVFLTQKLLPLLRQTKGQVINISSISGLFASPFLGPYATSKFAMEAFSDSLRRELQPFCVKVSSINPGAIRTPIWQKGLDNPKNQENYKHPIYGKYLLKLEKSVQRAARKSLDVDVVVLAVNNAYEKNIPRKVVAAKSIRLFLKLVNYLPLKLVDRLLKRF